MKNIFVIQLLIIVFVLLSKNAISQSTYEEILALNMNFSQACSVKMSELFSEISYLPLETKSDCLLGYINISSFGQDIIIRSNDDNGNVFRFSNKGKFINKIGNKGRGPGEYQDICDVRLIGDIVFIVSNFSNTILCYSLTGLLLKTYHLNIIAHPKSIVMLPDQTYMISLSNSSSLGNIIKTDINLNILKGFIKNVPLKNNPLPFRFEETKNKIYYYYNCIDTIFEISGGYPTPSIKINYGEFNILVKQSKNEKSNYRLNKPFIVDFSASDEYLNILIYYPFNKGTYTILYKQADGSQITWNQLINDIDNGTSERWLGFISENKIVYCLMASTILERFNNMTKAEKLDPKNSNFVTMASTITPESNPILMICTFK